MKTICVLTARMSSSRFYGKVMQGIRGRPCLALIVDRFRACEEIDSIIVATSRGSSDDVIAEWCKGKVDCYRGSLDNVMERIRMASRTFYGCEYVFRGLGDAPFIEPKLVDLACQVVRGHDAGRVFAGANQIPVYGAAEFPYSVRAIEIMALAKEGLEHPGKYLDDHRDEFDVVYPEPPPAYYSLFFRPYRLELDTPDDLKLIRAVYDHFKPDVGEVIPLRDVILYLDAHPEVANLNRGVAEKTGPLTSFSPTLRKVWAENMKPTKWVGDWHWLDGYDGEGRPLLCACGHRLGFVSRGPDKVHRLRRPGGDWIEGRAELTCPRCGEVQVWRLDKRAWRK